MNQELKKNKLVVFDAGLMRYDKALELQHKLCADRQADCTDNTVIILEHPPVITLGARKSENRLLVSGDFLRAEGIEVEHIGRGGGTTAHNPGQIVLYPIIKLHTLGLSINEYVRDLEAIGIDLLKEFGVDAGRRKGFPGLWVEGGKIGSIGVQVKKWVTLHGMSININNDLKIFEYIVPCGLEGVQMTSVRTRTGGDVPMSEVKKKLTGLCVGYWSHEGLAEYGNQT